MDAQRGTARVGEPVGGLQRKDGAVLLETQLQKDLEKDTYEPSSMAFTMMLPCIKCTKACAEVVESWYIYIHV